MGHNWENYRKMGITIEYLKKYIKVVHDLSFFDYPITQVIEKE